jgi:hypothetical protein
VFNEQVLQNDSPTALPPNGYQPTAMPHLGSPVDVPEHIRLAYDKVTMLPREIVFECDAPAFNALLAIAEHNNRRVQIKRSRKRIFGFRWGGSRINLAFRRAPDSVTVYDPLYMLGKEFVFNLSLKALRAFAEAKGWTTKPGDLRHQEHVPCFGCCRSWDCYILTPPPRVSPVIEGLNAPLAGHQRGVSGAASTHSYNSYRGSYERHARRRREYALQGTPVHTPSVHDQASLPRSYRR